MLGSDLLGQQRLSVPDRSSCVGCSIDLIRVARIGSPADSLYFDLDVSSLARDASGHFLVGPRARNANAAVTVFDSAGKYLSAFARPGQGPGEAQYLQLIIAARDSIYLFDRTRLLVFASDYRFVRQSPSVPLSISGGSAVVLATSPGRMGIELRSRE
jgi:hypothetical protein